MFRANRFKWALGIALIAAATAVMGSWVFDRDNDVPNAEFATASTLGIVASPQNFIVERPDQGGSSQVEFTLKNVGKQTVLVESVSTSCGCSVAQPMADQTIRPGQMQSLFISAEPPLFNTRDVHVSVHLVDAADSSREELIQLQMKLVGKPLPSSRVYNLPPVVELTSTSPGDLIRRFQFNTIEEERSQWITGLSSTSDQISAEILSCESVPRATGFQRTYHCRLTARVPESIHDIVAGGIRLASGNDIITEVSALRVIARRRVAWEAFPSVLKSPSTNAVEAVSQTVTVPAIDVEDVESLSRLEISDVPDGAVVKWLPSEEPRLRKLAVTLPVERRDDLVPGESISLLDPHSRNSLMIRLARSNEAGAE